MVDHHRLDLALSIFSCFLLVSAAAAQTSSSNDQSIPSQSNPDLLNQLQSNQSGFSQQDQQSEDVTRLLQLQEQQQQEQQAIRITNTPNRTEELSPDAAKARTSALQARTPATENNEFQNFVAQSVGQKLPIFGQSLFSEVPSTFAPMQSMPAAADYVVGPGDELLIRAWGSIDIDYRALVDRNGNIYIPKVGTVSVAGLQFQQLPSYLKSAVGKYFKNFDLSVNMGQLRSIQVFVVGQAKYAGSYTVSSLSTLVNAIFASGGPSSKGSMRHVQLKRGTELVTDFDLYDLISKGDKSKDARLMPGDVIYFAPVGPLVALFGSVNTPAIYELRDKTSLGDTIAFAGGLTTTASGEKAILERIDERNGRSAAELPLNPAGLEQPLKDGDIVRLIPISPRFDNAVTLRGNVSLPGRYPWHPGMRVRDLIPTRESLIVRNYWENQNALVKEQQPSIKSIPQPPSNNRSGTNTRSQDTQPAAPVQSILDPNRLGNEIKRNAPEINWDYAVIQRLNVQDLSSRLLPFNLGKAILDSDSANNLELQAGDIITIFSQADLKVPLAQQNKFVRLEGEFRAAGIYRLEPGESLRHLIERTGGLTENAYLFGSEFTRESTREDQQKRLDQYTAELERASQRNAIVAANRAPSADEAALIQSAGESQRRTIEALKQVKATGRVILGLKPASTGAAEFPDFALEDGDRLFVPYKPAIVQVVGVVYNQGAFLYNKQKRAGDYLRQAGGPTKDADKGHIFVIRANGAVVSSHGYSAFNGGISGLPIEPGDSIFVPENFTKGLFIRNMKDIAQILGQFGLAAAAINVLR